MSVSFFSIKWYIDNVVFPLGPLTQDWDAYAKIASGGTGTQFRGIIDEFYIFNCSLVDEQIRVIADTCKLREGMPLIAIAIFISLLH